MKKTVSIFGVTWSIGDSCIDIILSHKDNFDIVWIWANKNVQKLIDICKKIHPKYAVISDESLLDQLKVWLEWEEGITILGGEESLNKIASIKCDLFISAIVGIAGLKPTYNAIEAWSDIWLANKESLVCAGTIIMNKAKEKWVKVLPIDSEHNAIFQCIADNNVKDITSITLTASGGPFRSKRKEELKAVTKEMALKHPNWTMWQKISIDSATMINKWLEVIEAYHIFDIDPKKIDVVVHPESVIHWMVTYIDWNTLAAMSPPDMRVPIAHVLWLPEKLSINTSSLNLIELWKLTFEKPDLDKFEWLKLCLDLLKNNPGQWCILNAANEVAVEAFLNDEIWFLDIVKVIKETLNQNIKSKFASIEDVLRWDLDARVISRNIISELRKTVS